MEKVERLIHVLHDAYSVRELRHLFGWTSSAEIHGSRWRLSTSSYDSAFMEWVGCRGGDLMMRTDGEAFMAGFPYCNSLTATFYEAPQAACWPDLVRWHAAVARLGAGYE